MTAPPDIVLFMTDQQRFDQTGFGGDGFFETPSLDALAARGVVFDQAYSASTTCVPARSALLTGVQPHRHATQGAGGLALREGSWTLARGLRAAGYQTALVGKMHFAPIHADHGFDVMRTCEHLAASEIGTRFDGRPDLDDYHDWLVEQGVDEYRPTPGVADEIPKRITTIFPYDESFHPTSWVEREATEVLGRRVPDRPLFLVVSFPHPHAPLNPPEPYTSRYDPADVVLPKDGFEVNGQLPEMFLREMNESTAVYRPRRTMELPAGGLAARLNLVRALVRQIDDAIGRLLDLVSLERTLVFFTSDHGDYAGHRGLIQKSPWIPFDDLARVPFVVAGAGVSGGRRVQSIVQSYDVVPTACEVADVPVDLTALDARSLLPLLTDTSAVDEHRAAVFCTTMGWPGARIGSFKYLRHRPSGQGVLFDLRDDPGETTNLLGRPEYHDTALEVAIALQLSLEREAANLPTVAVTNDVARL